MLILDRVIGHTVWQTKGVLKIFLNFIYLLLSVLGLHCCVGFSLAAAMGATLSLGFAGFSLQWLLL